MATYASTYGNPDWYKKNMSGDVASAQAKQLGISTDQLFKLYAQTNQIGGVGMQNQGNMSPAQIAQWARGPGSTGGPMQNLITATPGSDQITQMYGPMAAWNQVNPPPQPQQQAPRMPSLGPQQPMPTVQTQALTPTSPYGGVGAAQAPMTPVSAAPPASAQVTTPLFNPLASQQPQLGVQPLQPGQIRQYAQGGLVQPQWFQGGGLVQNDQQVQSDQQVQNQPINIQQSDPGKWTGIYNPANLGNYLGALALNMPMAQPPQPGGTPSAKSGVSPVGGTQYYDIGSGSYQLPSGTVLTPEQMNSLDPASVAELQRGVGLGTVKYLTPQQAGPAARGPWANMPGIFNQAPMPTIQGGTAQLTPRTPANAAQMPQPGPMPTYAQQSAAPMPAQFNFGNVAAPPAPPPAPGVSFNAPQQPAPFAHLPAAQLFQAHTSALADAGKAMYAHFGGDPSTATHADIAGFHSELQGAIAGGPPIKRRSGGIVPGTGNSDSVPAMLTPGEYVINKDAVKGIGIGNLQAMNAQGFQDGGEVLPRETRHKAITADSPSSPSSPATQDSGQTSGTSGNPFVSSSPSTSQGPAWQGYAARANTPQSAFLGGAGGSGSQLTGFSGLPITTAGAPGATSTMTTPTPTGGISQDQAGAISSLGSGISQAFQTYAKSIGSWQPQKSAIPDPSSFKRPQTVTFSQEET